MRKIKELVYYWTPPLVWMAIIYYMSSQRSIGMTHDKTGDFIVFKSLHMVEYAFLFFLLYRAFNSVLRKYILFIALFLSICYSATDEFHQLFIATRTGAVRDVFIDMAGMLLMYGIIKNIRVMRKLL